MEQRQAKSENVKPGTGDLPLCYVCDWGKNLVLAVLSVGGEGKSTFEELDRIIRELEALNVGAGRKTPEGR